MLRACNKILKDGGRIAYTTIVIAEGLSKREHRIASRLGPRAVTARSSDDDLMARAGFVDVEVTDATASFGRVARAWHGEYARHEREVQEVVGRDEWEQRQTDRAGIIRAVDEGLLRRLLVSGRAT